MAVKFSDRLVKSAKKSRKRIGIALIRPSLQTVASLKRSKKFANIVIYGKPVSGIHSVRVKANLVGMQMARDFKSGKIDQLIRGQVDDFGMVEEAKKLFKIDSRERRIGFGLMQDAYGREFFLIGASNPDFQTLQEKLRVGTEVARWVSAHFGVKPKIAAMATCRPGSYGKDPVMSRTYDEAEEVVKYLQNLGYQARNTHIEIESAVGWCDILIPARGTIGNQIFRSLLYLGKGKNLATPTYFPGKLIYEDNSRNETDWEPHIIFAAAMANLHQPEKV